jgi:hypothetical protein
MTPGFEGLMRLMLSVRHLVARGSSVAVKLIPRRASDHAATGSGRSRASTGLLRRSSFRRGRLVQWSAPVLACTTPDRLARSGMAPSTASRLQCLDRPDGFVPPDSEYSAGWWVSEGRIMCAGCNHRTSTTAGALFGGTRNVHDGPVRRVLAHCHRRGGTLRSRTERQR